MKSQTSLDFLMTYGWAVLIIFIVTAVFVNFGANDPSRYSNERCLFETDFGCEEYGVEHIGSLVFMDLNLSNRLPYKINITGLEFVTLDGISGDVRYEFGENNPVDAGRTFRLRAIIDNPQYGFDLFKTKILLRYEVQRTGFFPKVAYGNVVAKIN